MKSFNSIPAQSGHAASLRRWLVFAGWCLGWLFAFVKPLWALALLARTDLHSHTLLVPFITAYLLWVERRRLPGEHQASLLPAAALAALALALVLLAQEPDSLASALGREGPVAFRVLALVSLVNAGGFLCFGWRWMWAAAFPMAFLLFMAPLPELIAFRCEEFLKAASTEVAAWFFDLAGVPTLRDGFFLRLPGLTIEVARECSGIRSTYVLLMTSLVVAFLFLRSPWRRAVLVAAIIPLGIVRNGFRILTLGWLCVQYGPHMIHHWIHHRGGPVFFVLSMVPLFLLLYGLWKSEHRRQPASPQTLPPA